MNAVRYLLSIYVIIHHVAVLAQVDLHFPMSYIEEAVGGFFALSGFLLFPSYQKQQDLSHYVSRRARRILPPYILIVVACTLLLFPLSSLSPVEYFTNAGTWKYLAANIVFLNFLHPSLPGVFEGPEYFMSAVNGSLWTMKGEWICYFSIPVVFGFISRIHKHKGGILLVCLILISMAAEAVLLHIGNISGNALFPVLAKQFGSMIVYFYIGALINYYFAIFRKYSVVIILLALCVIVFREYLPYSEIVFMPLSTSSIVLAASLFGKWGNLLGSNDNVSYDMYLFHFPIIQTAIYFDWHTAMSGWIFTLMIIIISYLTGMLSWYGLGRHIIKH